MQSLHNMIPVLLVIMMSSIIPAIFGLYLIYTQEAEYEQEKTKRQNKGK